MWAVWNIRKVGAAGTGVPLNLILEATIVVGFGAPEGLSLELPHQDGQAEWKKASV